MARLGGGLVAVGLSAIAVGALAAQQQYQGQETRRVSVDELVSTSMMYNESPVSLTAELRYSDSQDTDMNIFEIRGDNALQTIRVATANSGFVDLRFMVGMKVEITGIFFDLSSVMDPQRHPVLRYFPGAVRNDGMSFDRNLFIAVSTAEPILEEESDLKEKDLDDVGIKDPDLVVTDDDVVDLRDLNANPEPYMGKRIVLTGKFRGNNLYGDLDIKDKRTPRDFVIKVADQAIWVTGRRPRGKGFRLDAKKRRDTGEWLRVIGKPWEYEGTIYFKAEKIEIAEEPDNPDLEPVRVVHKEELEIDPPPEVTFALPLIGETGIPLDTEFQIQFSNKMNGASFNRNVDLLYGDDDGFGNPFPELEVHYDENSRVLTVRPNKPLEAGKEIRVILYDLIEDEFGQTLPPEPGVGELEPGAAVVLTYVTATS